jgi:hypothetical protein
VLFARDTGIPPKGKKEGFRMGNPGQIQTHVTPPAILRLGAIKTKRRTGEDGARFLAQATPTGLSRVNIPGLQTREIFSRVEAPYESLNVPGTKKAYRELNVTLEGLASKVVRTMEQIVPYLARMQALLSQRGADRKKILRKAGLPKWTQWAESYAQNLDCTLRTIQMHIKRLREGQMSTPAGWVGPYRPEEGKRKNFLTPPGVYSSLDAEFQFDFDPCPYPCPEGYDSLTVEWGRSSYVNPPFHKQDGVDGQGPTAFVHKAIEENRKGKKVVLMLPIPHYVSLLLEAGAEVRSAGRVRWHDVERGMPFRSPLPIGCFILK